MFIILSFNNVGRRLKLVTLICIFSSFTAFYGCLTAPKEPNENESPSFDSDTATDIEGEKEEKQEEKYFEGYLLKIDGVEAAYIHNEEELETIAELLCSIQKSTLEANGINVESIELASELEISYIQIKESELLDIPSSELDTVADDLRLLVNYRVTELHTEIIDFSTVYKNSSSYYEGTEFLSVEGEQGEKALYYVVTYNGSEEAARELSHEQTIKEAKDAVILVGTKKSTASTGSYAWPLSKVYITSYFGRRTINGVVGYHYGIDLRASIGTSVYAADGGEVIYCGTASGYGKLIKIRHDNGDITYYAHLNSYSVSVGSRVYKGQLIAKSGATGRVTGPHLHFEIRKNGTTQVNPLKYLP